MNILNKKKKFLIYSINKKINVSNINDNLSKLKNIENKYQYIIELGNILIKMPSYMINYKNIIYDCQSNVWCNAILKENKIIVYGYSNSVIINGLIAILYTYFNKECLENFKKLNFRNIIKEIKFIKKFTTNKYNNLFIIEKYLKLKISKLI